MCEPQASLVPKPQTAWLCFQCGADFRDWTALPYSERMAFLMAHREFDIARLLDDCCPRCNAPLTVAAAQTGERAVPTSRIH